MLYQIQINRTINGPRSTINPLRCKIDQSRMSITRGQNIYVKTPRISIEKHIKTGMLTIVNVYVPIKLHKNTVLIRDKHNILQ